MGNEPLISVCMPVYNDEKTIERALQSVFDQTYQHFEIIISDNQSEDRTFELVSRIQDPRIVLSRNDENTGFILNSNKVMRSARGEYVVILHGDDYYTDMDYLRNVANIFDANKDTAVIHFIAEKDKRKHVEGKTVLNAEEYYSFAASLKYMPAPTVTAYRNRFLKSSQYYGQHYWTGEARLSMNIARQGGEVYFSTDVNCVRGTDGNESSLLHKQITRFREIFDFYREMKDDGTILQNYRQKLSDKVLSEFFVIFNLRNKSPDGKKAYREAKKQMKRERLLPFFQLNLMIMRRKFKEIAKKLK